MKTLKLSVPGWLAALFIAVVMILMGCAETAHVMKDSSVDMKQYKTYAWVQKTTPKDAKPNHNNDLTEQNIRVAVTEQLQKRGYIGSPTNPDLLLSADLLVEKDQERRSDAVYTEPYTQNYYSPRNGRLITYYFPSQFAGYNNYSATVRKGTITLTFIDARTDKAVWQAWASKRLDNSNIDSDEIAQDVKSIFNKFDGN
jgi:hypothetical protein